LPISRAGNLSHFPSSKLIAAVRVFHTELGINALQMLAHGGCFQFFGISPPKQRGLGMSN